MASLEITKTKNTIIVRFGRQIESISTDKSLVELVDCVKWAAITMGAVINETIIADIVSALKNDS